jgi:hypothetical protein
MSINKSVNYKRSRYYEDPSRNFSHQRSYSYFQGFRNAQKVTAVKPLKSELHIHGIYEDSFYLTGNQFHLTCKKKND